MDSESPLAPGVAARYRERLARRFDEVAGRLRDSPAAGERFASAWATWSGLPAAARVRILALPLLDAWIGTARHLAALGLFERYPDAHPGRHLAELGRVVLAGVDAEAEGAAGTAALLGRPTLPLAGGRAVLAAAEPRDGVLEWRVEGGGLRLALGGEEVATVGLGGRLGEAELAPGWTLRRLPEVGGVVADAGFPHDAAAGRAGVGRAGAGARRTESALMRPLEQLAALADDRPLRAVRAHLACVVPARDDHPRWVAGAARWPRTEPAGEPWLHLTFLALRDRAERLLRLTLAPEARTMLPAGVADLAAWRLTDRLLGGRRDDGSEVARSWRRRARRIAGLPGGPALLEALGEEPGPAAAGPAEPGPAGAGLLRPGEDGAEPEPPSPAVTPLPALAPLAQWNDPPAAPFTLVKSRAGERRTLDWRALDRLAHADRARVAATLDALGAIPAPTEADAYAQALLSYLLGRFADVRRALTAALGHDAGVEEYWHLLAFALRHLGDRAGFERIVFAGGRDPALAGPAAPAGARG